MDQGCLGITNKRGPILLQPELGRGTQKAPLGAGCAREPLSILSCSGLSRWVQSPALSVSVEERAFCGQASKSSHTTRT